MLPHPIVHHPFAYDVGPIQLTGFGIAILLCFVVAQVVAERELVRRGHDPAPIPDMIFAALVGGLLGAKLYYVVVLGHWDSIFDRTGFVYWGGFIGGALAVTGVVLHKRAGLWKMSDVSAPALAGAYAIGRTGCWAIGDDYGRPWNGFLAVSFPDGAPPSTAAVMSHDFGAVIPAGVSATTVLSVFPTQLLEVLMGLGMFAILWRLRDHRHAEGWLFGLYLVLSGVERFLIEFLRAKDDRFIAGLTYAQLIAMAVIAIGAIVMVMRWRVGPGKLGISARAATVAALFVCIGAIGCTTPSGGGAEANAGVDSLNARIVQAYRTHDPQAYAAAFTDTAVFEWPAFTTVRGRPALAAMARSNWAALRDMDLRLTVANRRVAANAATEFGAFEQSWSDSSGARRTEFGRYTAVLVKEGDDRWRMDRFFGFEDSTRVTGWTAR